MTREQLLQLQQAYFDAELAVLQGKSITLNGQSMTMESLGDIRRGRKDDAARDKYAHFREINSTAAMFQYLQKNYNPTDSSFL